MVLSTISDICTMKKIFQNVRFFVEDKKKYKAGKCGFILPHNDWGTGDS